MKVVIRLFLLLFLFGSGQSLTAETRRYRLSWAEDPATSMSIAFEFTRGRNVYVAYDTENGGGVPSNYRYKAAPTHTKLSKGMRTVFVRLRDLRPETVYHFMVVDDQGLSRPMSFETPPNRLDKRLSFIAGGDSREHQVARRKSNVLVSKLRPHAVLFSGDMTTNDTPADWAQWLDDWQLTISADGRCYPIVPARGNHERANTSISEMFDVPNPRIHYALDFAGGLLRTYTLNSMAVPSGDQLVWLKDDLRSHPNVVWKIAQYHNSMRPHTKVKKVRNDLAKYWAPLFYRHGVNLVIESDAHVVKQTYPLRPSNESGSDDGFIRDDLSGTTYIGEGCWGAPLRVNNHDRNWTQASGSFNQIKWLWVDANSMEVRTIITDNSSHATSLLPHQRFEVPRGLSLWKPKGKEALVLKKAGPKQVAMPAPPVHRDNAPPAAWPTGGGSVATPSGGNKPPGNSGGIARPAPLPNTSAEVLKPDFNHRVGIEYTLLEAGPVTALVVTDRLILFKRMELEPRARGVHRQRITLPEIPRNVKWELVIKSGKKVIKKYVLSTQPD